MIRKIFLASALVASSAFATWDLFPVLANHKGQAKVAAALQTYEYMRHDFGVFGTAASARYTVIPKLELALDVPYRIMTQDNGREENIDGLGNIGFSSRYQFLSSMNAFVDMFIPVGDDSYNEKGAWGFNVGAQYSVEFSQMLNFGSELGINFETKGDDHEAPVSVFGAAEIDFRLSPQFTPYFGTNLAVGIGAFKHYEFLTSLGGGEVYIEPYFGGTYDINHHVSLDVSASFGNWINADNKPSVITTASLALLFNF